MNRHCQIIAAFFLVSINTQAAEAPLLPARQVHLDFHTSEHIAGIGEKFSKTQFQEALRAGHVNQINIFAKCHHSWSYYPTKIGRMHPNLKFDLLGEQIAACHEMGVVCPIYFTVGWSASDAEAHPEWLVRDRKGQPQADGTFDFNAKATDAKPWGWKKMCAAATGSYHAHILKQVEEICEGYPVDGLWFDIYHDQECHCAPCLDRLKKEGVDPANSAAVTRSHTLSIKEHMRQLRELIARHHPKATVYFNSATHPGDSFRFKERLYEMNTQQELEDLPTTWGGYDKLPIEARFHLINGSRVLAMSGKFHKAWGEFGGFKHPDAIKYEAAAMIANGAGCNFGDQLHPSGEMDMGTYRNIGEAYAYVEKIEDYGPGGVPCSKLGLWLTLNPAADGGAAAMLLEMHQDFVPADERNLDTLSCILIPSASCLSKSQAKSISEWCKRGGKLIVFGAGALDSSQSRLLLDIGAEYLGAPEFKFDYTVVKPEISNGIVQTPFLNYEAGLRVKPTSGLSLASIREPYFDRTYGQYSSHANTPYRLEDSACPAIVRNGNTIFFAHALDRLYHANGVRLYRDLVRNAMDQLDLSPQIKVSHLPSSGRISLLQQKGKNRYVAHLLYSPALQRGDCKVIEDFPTLSGVELEIFLPEKISKIRTVPGDQTIEFTRSDNLIRTTIPSFSMHTAIVLEY